MDVPGSGRTRARGDGMAHGRAHDTGRARPARALLRDRHRRRGPTQSDQRPGGVVRARGGPGCPRDRRSHLGHRDRRRRGHRTGREPRRRRLSVCLPLPLDRPAASRTGAHARRRPPRARRWCDHLGRRIHPGMAVPRRANPPQRTGDIRRVRGTGIPAARLGAVRRAAPPAVRARCPSACRVVPRARGRHHPRRRHRVRATRARQQPTAVARLLVARFLSPHRGSGDRSLDGVPVPRDAHLGSRSISGTGRAARLRALRRTGRRGRCVHRR